jgi:hypothetical protein
MFTTSTSALRTASRRVVARSLSSTSKNGQRQRLNEEYLRQAMPFLVAGTAAVVAATQFQKVRKNIRE